MWKSTWNVPGFLPDVLLHLLLRKVRSTKYSVQCVDIRLMPLNGKLPPSVPSSPALPSPPRMIHPTLLPLQASWAGTLAMT